MRITDRGDVCAFAVTECTEVLSGDVKARKTTISDFKPYLSSWTAITEGTEISHYHVSGRTRNLHLRLGFLQN